MKLPIDDRVPAWSVRRWKLMVTGPDSAILALTRAEHRVGGSADTDFPALLAASGDVGSSVMLISEVIQMPPTRLGQLAGDLERCVVAAIRTARISVRDLPLPSGRRD